jgi:hypothetical protein
MEHISNAAFNGFLVIGGLMLIAIGYGDKRDMMAVAGAILILAFAYWNKDAFHTEAQAADEMLPQQQPGEPPQRQGGN